LNWNSGGPCNGRPKFFVRCGCCLDHLPARVLPFGAALS
jgi:hypothetical protein